MKNVRSTISTMALRIEVTGQTEVLPKARKCVCCGAPTPTRSMCACWEHWMALPENLRSDLLASYGRGELTNYHRNLLRAVEIWRRCGLWCSAPR